MDQGTDFTLLNGELDKSLYYIDDLHLVSEGFVKFAKSITNVIVQQSTSTTSTGHGEDNGGELATVLLIYVSFILTFTIILTGS